MQTASLEQLKAIREGTSTSEDRYISDRAAYMAGRRGDDRVYTNQRDVDMYFMGLHAYNRFGDE